MIRFSIAIFALVWLMVVIGRAARFQDGIRMKERGENIAVDDRLNNAGSFLAAVFIEFAAIVALGFN